MFHELATQPKKLASYLDEHEQRVSWHLERLYRFRCCLVHGTPVVTPLQLPTANLEYYLRECIYLVLDTLLAAPQIPTLEVIFERAKSAATRRRTLLTDSSAALAAILPALETSFIFPIASP